MNGLTALAVTNGGTGYQVPPAVVISAGDGGATGTVTVNANGAIQSINAQGGTAFTAPPPFRSPIPAARGSGRVL